jgi:threonine synthase
MRYCNIRDRSIKVTFREAVSRGISADMGLFMPEIIPHMEPVFFRRLPGMTLQEIAFEVGGKYTGDEIPAGILKTICEEAFNFPVSLRKISDRKQVLELFYGPTAAFKDFGARFMAQCFRYFSETDDLKTVVLVATSGDTGGAIANSFCGMEGIDVIILYPSGKVSRLQENQMTTLGQNITALEIEGTFDDCQSMVKSAFTRLKTHGKIRLTSANSINIARLIPQSFYYYFAVSRAGFGNKIISVPSGNFGNLTAAVMAWRSGLQIEHFIAATNINNVVPEYLRTGLYSPGASVQTIASAMDVGNPSNFERLLDIFDNDRNKMSSVVSGFWFDDDQVRQHIRAEYQRSGYALDPHGAVASLGLDSFLDDHAGTSGIFVETAHPAKFSDIVEPLTGNVLPVPASLQGFLTGSKEALMMKPGSDHLEEYLRNRYSLD